MERVNKKLIKIVTYTITTISLMSFGIVAFKDILGNPQVSMEVPLVFLIIATVLNVIEVRSALE